MSASTIAKKAGCKSVVEVGQITDTPISTLFDMFNAYPLRYQAVCLGAGVMKTNGCLIMKYGDK